MRTQSLFRALLKARLTVLADAKLSPMQVAAVRRPTRSRAEKRMTRYGSSLGDVGAIVLECLRIMNKFEVW
eukprot:10633-Pleurochrysis_carterae.AAC.2